MRPMTPGLDETSARSLVVRRDVPQLHQGVPMHQHTNPDGSVGGWVAQTAHVDPTVFLGKDVVVSGSAKVLDHAVLVGSVKVYDHAIVSGYARLSGEAKVCGHSRVRDQAVVRERALLSGRAEVSFAGEVYGDAWLGGPGLHSHLESAPRVVDQAQVYGHARLGDETLVSGFAQVYDEATARGRSGIGDYARVYGRAELIGASVYNCARVYGDAKLHGARALSCAWIGGHARLRRGDVAEFVRVCGGACERCRGENPLILKPGVVPCEGI